MLQAQALPWASPVLHLHFHHDLCYCGCYTRVILVCLFLPKYKYLVPEVKTQTRIWVQIIYFGVDPLVGKWEVCVCVGGRICVKEQVDALRKWDSVLWKSVTFCVFLPGRKKLGSLYAEFPLALGEVNTRVNLAPHWVCAVWARQAIGSTQGWDHGLCLGNVRARKRVCRGNVCGSDWPCLLRASRAKFCDLSLYSQWCP